MVSNEQKENLILTLQERPIISYACKKVGIARATYYRLIEDSVFRTRIEQAINMGIHGMCDLAESKLIQAANNGEPWAIRYILTHHHPKYFPKDIYARREKELDRSARVIATLDVLRAAGVVIRARNDNSVIIEEYVRKYCEDNPT